MSFFSLFKVTLPVLAAYIVLGVAFGLLATKMSVPWYLTISMSIFIYAGAGQFLALSLFSAGASMVEIAFATFLLNLRHSFYGLSMINDFKDTNLAKPYLIFSLTDETFALLKTTKVSQKDKNFSFFTISLLNQVYWVTGTALGIIGGFVLPFNEKGIEFCLTALFVVLSIELYKSNPNLRLLLLTLALGLIGMLFLPSSQMLIITIFSSTIALLSLRGWITNKRVRG